jgi:hypothetical protein
MAIKLVRVASTAAIAVELGDIEKILLFEVRRVTQFRDTPP